MLYCSQKIEYNHNGWKDRLLSNGEKMILIKYVLSSITLSYECLDHTFKLSRDGQILCQFSTPNIISPKTKKLKCLDHPFKLSTWWTDSLTIFNGKNNFTKKKLKKKGKAQNKQQRGKDKRIPVWQQTADEQVKEVSFPPASAVTLDQPSNPTITSPPRQWVPHSTSNIRFYNHTN